MSRQIRVASFVLALFLLNWASPLRGQQKPQWLPGQVGLNAGIAPAPGFSYVNISVNYRSSAFNNASGSAIPVTGNYNVWAVENLFYGVLDTNVVHGNIFFLLGLVPATGELVADLATQNPGIPNLSAVAGGSGLTDTFVEPFGLAWHLKRADFQIAEGMVLPTGRYTPGASNNVGSGYFGNHLIDGITYYITKNKGTSANLFTDWEVHGARRAPTAPKRLRGRPSPWSGVLGKFSR